MMRVIQKNRTPFTDAEVADATGGRLVRGFPPTAGVATDPGSVTAGALFVDLSGGAAVAAAAEAGASAFVLSEQAPQPRSGGVVTVSDPLGALLGLARAHRRRWAAAPHREGERWVAGVAGSWGRTLTARALSALLVSAAGPARVMASSAGHDDRASVAGLLLSLEDRHRYLVLELGTGTPDELGALLIAAEPQVGVLTRSAPSALGTFEGGDPAELLYRLRDGAVAVVDADDGHAARVPRNQRLAEVVRCGLAEDASYRLALRVPLGAGGNHLQLTRDLTTSRKLGSRRETEVEVPLLGEPGVRSALLSLGAAEHLLGRPFPPDRVAEALTGLGKPAPGQLGLTECEDGTLLLDDRDANVPEAARGAIATAREIANLANRRLVAVLGEMDGLGPLAPAEHETIGAFLASVSPSAVVAVGGEAARIARRTVEAGIPSRFVPADAPVLVSLLESVRPGDVVLMKGSERLAFPHLVEELVVLSVPR